MEVKVVVRTHAGWSTIRALVDCGSSLNFISQMCVKELGIQTSGHRPPGIRTFDRHKLQTYGTYCPDIRLTDSNGDMLNANMMRFDMILRMPWLDQYDPNIRWRKR